ncbi:MAG TPA: AMP-binding protein, partial [Candidatus Polarisedimenticolia bacterium]|nr:AMP-binding protein [Candidatus Polarisedimenticolia bacterium]
MDEERMQAGSGRRNLLSYLDGFPLHRARPLYLWRDGVRWRRRSYGEVHDRSLACAGMLAGAGIGPGDAVLIQGPEAADWAEALHAVLRVGGVAVPLSPETPDEFRCKVARKVEATVLIAPVAVTPPPHVERI